MVKMRKPRVIVLRTAGTNCDNETAVAFKMAGGEPELVHINELARDEKFLKDYQILAIPGGFTYGDDIASGKILANEIKYKLNEDIKNFINSGKLIIGICNGFQALVKAGILPGVNSGAMEATLSFNDSGSFIDKWVYLKAVQGSRFKVQRNVAYGQRAWKKQFICRLRTAKENLYQEIIIF